MNMEFTGAYWSSPWRARGKGKKLTIALNGDVGKTN
jgi:hypothetical protein